MGTFDTRNPIESDLANQTMIEWGSRGELVVESSFLVD